MKKFLTATVMAAAMAAVSAPAQAQVRITGTTTGCFYTTAFTCLHATTYNGLTFTGGSFDIDLADPGSLHELNTLSDYLGKFTLASGTDFDFGANDLRFRLSVNFTSPTGASPNPAYFIAKFYGEPKVNDDCWKANCKPKNSCWYPPKPN